jgi:hypothetical protein
VRGKGTKLGEGERDLEGERAYLGLSGLFRDYYVWDYYANPDSGRLRSGLFCSGIVRGAKDRWKRERDK